MNTEKIQKNIWLDFRVDHKEKGFNTDIDTDINSTYMDFKVPVSIPDLTFKGPIPYDLRYYSDDTLEFQLSNENDGIWETFYKHATFYEILKSQDIHGSTGITSSDIPKNSFFEIHERFPIGELNAYLPEYYKLVLRATRDKPEILLITDKPADALLHFLRIARYSIDRDKAIEARNVIIDCLLPSFKKTKGYALPSNEIFKLMRQLLIKLATDLSGKCKNALREYANYDRLTRRDILDAWTDHYTYIVTWSQVNDGRIYEIANESESSIKKLLLSPASYVNNVLQAYYQISLRTLKSIK